ncbi:hypothetical protein ACLBWP_16630 [Microbacterium sp. M1A1_1b]
MPILQRSSASRVSSLTTRAVLTYAVVIIGTLVALGVLSAVDPGAATSEDWVHMVIVACLGLLLAARLRSALRGQRRGLVAVGVIAVVLALANIVEALLPGLFTPWMRVEMALIAVLMVVLAAASRRDLRRWTR